MTGTNFKIQIVNYWQVWPGSHEDVEAMVKLATQSSEHSNNLQKYDKIAVIYAVFNQKLALSRGGS